MLQTQTPGGEPGQTCVGPQRHPEYVLTGVAVVGAGGQPTCRPSRSSSRSKQQSGAWTLWSALSRGSQQKALLQELQGKSRPCGGRNDPLKTTRTRRRVPAPATLTVCRMRM